jgi:hypothetical protein
MGNTKHSYHLTGVAPTAEIDGHVNSFFFQKCARHKRQMPDVELGYS